MRDTVYSLPVRDVRHNIRISSTVATTSHVVAPGFRNAYVFYTHRAMNTKQPFSLRISAVLPLYTSEHSKMADSSGKVHKQISQTGPT